MGNDLGAIKRDPRGCEGIGAMRGGGGINGIHPRIDVIPDHSQFVPEVGEI